MVEIVAEQIDGDVGDNLGDLTVVIPHTAKAGEVVVADPAALVYDRPRKLQGRLDLAGGRGPLTAVKDVLVTEADHLADRRMGRQAVVAAVDLGDRQRNLLTQRGRQGAHGHIDGWIDDGVVALSGYVTHGYKADRIALLVSRVHGVKEIQNQIAVLPTSTSDDQLRFELAKNIYGNPLFWNDATRNNPPIRIIVDNLHVTLAGVVFSEVEKRVAADIVRQTVGVLTFRNNLDTEGEIKG